MNRNKTVNEKAFPEVVQQRSGFHMRPSFKTTFRTGELFPVCDPIEVYPGDTFSVDMSSLVRMAVPQTAVMDNAYLDTFAFFVPMRLVWDNTKHFFGEKDPSRWEEDVEYEIPQVTLDSSQVSVGSLADHFGIAPLFDADGTVKSGRTKKVSALPFRAYHLIFNDWFLAQQVQTPAIIPRSDNGNDGFPTLYNMRAIGKFHDMFVDALPEPQYGEAVQIPIGSVPVKTSSVMYTPNNTTMRMNFGAPGVASEFNSLNIGLNRTSTNGKFSVGVTGGSDSYVINDSFVTPMNLYAVNDSDVSSIGTINDLRYAFAVQRMLERENYGGTRYTEIIRSFFGVISPDGRQQRPEYLGGSRVNINMAQTIQTSSTDSTSPQGNIVGVSKTADSGSMFTRSFTEHGMIIILAAVRTEQTYQRGLNKYWTKKDKLDFYFTPFANIGNQPILKQELAMQWNDTFDESVFGYQEAYYDLRFMPSKVSGYFRSQAQGSLDVWHYAEDLHGNVVLGNEFIKQDDSELDRTLAISADTSGFQFFGDFYLNMWVSRVLPMYSYPGLVDHL